MKNEGELEGVYNISAELFLSDIFCCGFTTGFILEKIVFFNKVTTPTLLCDEVDTFWNFIYHDIFRIKVFITSLLITVDLISTINFYLR